MTTFDDSQREHLRASGWLVHRYERTAALDELTTRLATALRHHDDLADDERLELVAQVTKDVAASGLVHRLLRDNADVFVELLGPDVDVQQSPHLRVVRGQREGDQVDWHRDSFYGAGAYEISCWTPLAELGDGAGLRLLPGSHRRPSTNLRSIVDDDAFRRGVTKGSVAHDIGFPYEPKVDDVAAGVNDEETVLVAPPVGSCVIFFSSMVHRGDNRSDRTRVSVDVRLHNPHTPTGVKAGYYVPLVRGVVSDCADAFMGVHAPA